VNIAYPLGAWKLVPCQADAAGAFPEDSMTSVARQERAEVVLDVLVAVAILDQEQLGG
jgi:hypothetical protein